MEIRCATVADLPEIWDMYAAVTEAMQGSPYDAGWSMGAHPALGELEAAVESGGLIAAFDDGAPGAGAPVAASRVLGAFALDGRQDAGYDRAAWLVDAPESGVAVIHLLAVHPAARGRGVGRALVDTAARCARGRGAACLRLDVVANNEPAFALYRSCGFADLGVFSFAYDDGYEADAHLMELDLSHTAPGASARAHDGAGVRA